MCVILCTYSLGLYMQQQNVITKTAEMVNTVPRVATAITSGLTVYKRMHICTWTYDNNNNNNNGELPI